MAGEYPGDWNDKETRKRLRGLLNEGVTFFLDLTQAAEYDLKPYAPLLDKEAAALGQQVEHWRMAIQDRGTPTPALMTRILDTIDAALAAGETVYVHCYAGIGRTGTVVGCYLVRHGISGEEALAEIPRLRRDMWGGWVSSPETAAQRAMVREWPIGS
jgi:protein-tyrosine phosphatase